MAVTLTTSGAVLLKAGANVSSTISTDANLEIEAFINQAEAVISAISRKDWVDSYGAADVNTKLILDQTCSDLAAMYAIQYDMGNYNRLLEAQTMLDVLSDASLRGLSILKDQKGVKFVNDGA